MLAFTLFKYCLGYRVQTGPATHLLPMHWVSHWLALVLLIDHRLALVLLLVTELCFCQLL